MLVATRLVAHFDQQRQLKTALPNSRWRRRAVRTHHNWFVIYTHRSTRAAAGDGPTASRTRRVGGTTRLHANQAPLPVIWRHSRSSAFPRALDAVTECSQSTHPTHRWMRKPGSPFEEHFGQQAPAAQLTGAQAPAGELIGHRSPARSRAAFAPRPSGRSCWPLTASAPARQISSVKRTQSTRRDKDGTLFLSACRISNCARTKCTGGNRRAG